MWVASLSTHPSPLALRGARGCGCGCGAPHPAPRRRGKAGGRAHRSCRTSARQRDMSASVAALKTSPADAAPAPVPAPAFARSTRAAATRVGQRRPPLRGGVDGRVRPTLRAKCIRHPLSAPPRNADLHAQRVQQVQQDNPDVKNRACTGSSGAKTQRSPQGAAVSVVTAAPPPLQAGSWNGSALQMPFCVWQHGVLYCLEQRLET